MTIGIDFSITSSALTIKYNNELFFYTFARENIISEDVLNGLKKSNVQCLLSKKNERGDKKLLTTILERISITDANALVEKILNAILEKSKECDSFAIEGFSFGSTGNVLAQISGYQWMLRKALTDKFGINKMWIYAPTTVKATAGKGNYKKEEMINKFIESKDVLLNRTSFWIAMKTNPHQFQTKNGKWKKPIEDIVDSYWVLKTLERLIGELPTHSKADGLGF